MYNTFQLDVEEDLNQNHSAIKNHLNERNDYKFAAGTITKNFFANADDEDEVEYRGKVNANLRQPKYEKRQSQQPIKPSPTRRQKKTTSTLTPIKQSNQVEVFQNYQKDNENNDLEAIQLQNSKLPSKSPENDIKKRSQRRKLTKKQQQQQTESKQQKKHNVKQQIKLAPKPTQIFFEQQDDVQLEQQKQQTNEHIDIPQTRLNNEFVQSDDQPIVVTTQQIENIITGSQYFNFSNEVTLIKQLFLDIRQKTTLKMEIIRDKDGFNTFWPEFHLHFSEDSHYVMSAKKTSSRPTSTFIISRTRNNFEEVGPQYLGKMKSNVLGDILNIFGPGTNPSNAKEKGIPPRQLLATVQFMTSLFQMGKPREFRLYIKRPQYQYYKHFPQVKIYEDQIPLSTLYEFPENQEKIRMLHNRQPVWMKEVGGYMLNFKGRVERPSIKNFILQETLNGPDVVLFGKLNENKFNFDVSSRISTYIAFAVALSSFDSRLMCE